MFFIVNYTRRTASPRANEPGSYKGMEFKSLNKILNKWVCGKDGKTSADNKFHRLVIDEERCLQLLKFSGVSILAMTKKY